MAGRLAGLYWAKPDVITAVSAAAASAASSSFELPDDVESAMFLFDITTATGTTPTLDIKVQTSPDAGTTYFDVFRSSQITAASMLRMNCVFKSSPENTASTATNASGGNMSVITLATSGALMTGCPIAPKYMRIRYVIGGTNPVFTFTTDVITRQTRGE